MRTVLWLGCALMCGALAAESAAPAANAARPEWLGRIRRDHPRLFFNRDTWPQVKARAEGPAARARARLLARCDAYPTNPVCGGTALPTNRPGCVVDPVHTAIPPITEWGTQSAECALAWRLTGRPAYLEKAKAMLRANVRGYQEAYANRRAVNWYSTTRINALCAYDWIFEALTDDERRAIIVPLVQHCEDVQPRAGRPPVRRRNTGGVKAGCYGVRNLMWYAGLAAFGDGHCDALAESLLVEGHDYHEQVLAFRNASAGDDGALGTATPGYAMGVYPVGHFNIFHTWLSATGENLAARYPAMALYPNWVWWMWIPDAERPSAPLFLGAGDAFHTHNRLPVRNLYEHLLQYVHFFKAVDPAAARLAATLAGMCPNHAPDGSWTSGSGFPAYPFLFGPDADVKPYTQAELAASDVKARHFEQLGQIFMRSGWSADDVHALLMGGTRCPMHKHYDEGHFAIYRHDFLALDTGSRADQTDWNLKHYYAQSVAHNVVLIRRPGEPLPGYWGPTCPDAAGRTNDGGMYGGAAKVLAFETHARFSYAALDTTALYRAKCRECVRQVVHVQPDVFVVYDRVGAADPADAKAWLLHTQHAPVVTGRVVRADARRGRLFCETLLPTDARLVCVGGPERAFWSNGRNWEIEPSWLAQARRACEAAGRGPYWGEWRVETQPGAPRADDRFLHVLTATDTTAPAGVVARRIEEANRDGVVLTFADGEEVALLFARTGPVGGEIRLGGTARPLATTVTPQRGVLMHLDERQEAK